MKIKALISLLADGMIHSGASLAAEFGVSRTAIWKLVNRAAEKGYRIETIRGKGYRLTESVDLLDYDALLATIPAVYRDRIQLQVMDTVDSTNAEVIRRRSSGQSGILICLADTQTAGRGRRGRVWQSPAGDNLYLSLGLTLRGGFSAIEGLSLVIGVALAEALEALGVGDIGLKWPNDLQSQGKKLAGILIELQGELEGAAQVVAGVGLNVHMIQAPAVDQAWTSLALVGGSAQKWKRNEIAATLIVSVLDAVESFSEQGFSAFRERWQQRDVFLGQPLTTSQREIQGVGRGIDESGHYRVETPDGIEVVRAGEISLRMDL